MDLPDECMCRELLSQYRSMMSGIKELLKKPKKLLRELKDWLDYPFARANLFVNSIADAVADALDFGIPDLSKNVRALANALKRLLSCPFLADSALGMLAASALDAIEGGLKDVTGIMEQLKSMLVSSIMGALDKVKGMLDKTLGAIQSMYDALLDSLGITSMLSILGQIETCFGNLCNTWASAHNVANKVMGYMPDDSTDVWKAVGKRYDAVTNKLVTIKDEATERALKESEAFSQRCNTLVENCKQKVAA